MEQANADGFDFGTRLPLEILPHILSHLSWRVRDLAACALVARSWNRYATPLLYARLFLRDQRRVRRVFASLEANKHLAKLVRVLEIRVFPFGLPAEELEKLEASLLRSLQHCEGLEELYWTRTGSLTDRVVPDLPKLPSLHTLELTGSSRFYTPASITTHLLAPSKTPNLRHFSLVLPDRDVAAELPNWASQLGEKLESFSVLCQHSAIITDELLARIAEHLSGLRRLSIAGCKWVTAEGLLPLLRSAEGQIRELAIEGLAIHPSTFHTLARYLPHLVSLSITYPRPNLCSAQEHWQALASLVEDLPDLQAFTHYTSSWNTPKGMYSETLDSDQDDNDDDDGGAGAERHHGQLQQQRRQTSATSLSWTPRPTNPPVMREPKLSATFLRRLIMARGAQLSKLRIHGIATSTEQLGDVCSGCPQLRDLVLHLYESDKPSIAASISKLPMLASLHILSSLYADLFLSEDDLKHLATVASPELRQIGFRNRVWLVERSSSPMADQVGADGDDDNDRWRLQDGRIVSLKRWDMAAGTFPEVLLVVRACE